RRRELWSRQRDSNPHFGAGDAALFPSSHACPDCHIPNFQRTFRVAPVAVPARQIWYPTRDSNPDKHVSETCAYVQFRQRGKNKKPGDLAATRAWKGRTKKFVASILLRSGSRARAHRRARRRPAAARLSATALFPVAISYRAFQILISEPTLNASLRAALTLPTKKPGALSRSGLVKARQLPLADSPARTRAVLTGIPVMLRLRCVACMALLHQMLHVKGAHSARGIRGSQASSSN